MYASKEWVKDLMNKVIKKILPFRFGVDSNGNYGYYKAGADTLTPFKSTVSKFEDYTLSGSTITFTKDVSAIHVSYMYRNSSMTKTPPTITTKGKSTQLLLEAGDFYNTAWYTFGSYILTDVKKNDTIKFTNTFSLLKISIVTIS